MQKQKVLYGNLLKWICIDIEGSWLLIEPFLGKKKGDRSQSNLKDL